METILPYLGVEAVYSEEELKHMTATVPGYVGWRGTAAIQNAQNRGIEVEIIGDENGVICKQYPEKDTVLEKNSAKIILYTDKSEQTQTVKVPDLIGKSAAAANQTLINAGLNVRILGTKNYLTGTGAVVIEQSIAPGTEVPRGTVVEVTFRYLGSDDYYEESFDHLIN